MNMMKGVKDNYVDQDFVESYSINNDFLFPFAPYGAYLPNLRVYVHKKCCIQW